MPQLLTAAEIETILKESECLLTIAGPIIKNELYQDFADQDQLIILCNHEGYALDLLSSPQVLEQCSRMNIRQGACFIEEICGANAIALAMRLKRMAVVSREQHYCQLFKDWSCIAAPIYSPGGDIIAFLDVSLDCEQGLGSTPALMRLAVKHIEKMYAERVSTQTAATTAALPGTYSKSERLSLREKEIVRLIAEGQTTMEIATALGLSYETVKTHRGKIYRKLGGNKKSECLKKARQLRLLQ